MTELHSQDFVTPLQSFNIGMIFLSRLSPIICRDVLASEINAYESHRLFLGLICLEAEEYEKWAEAIFYATKPVNYLSFEQFLTDLFSEEKLSIDYQEKAEVPAQNLLSIVTEFCTLLNHQYNLNFVIHYLNEMQQKPQEYVEAWELWKITLSDVSVNKKYLCTGFFWRIRERLGRFESYNKESQEAMELLFSSQENLVAESTQLDIYLKDLPDKKQLWGYVDRKSNTVADFGINIFPNQFLRGWCKDPLHENGGYLAAQADPL